MVVSHDRYFVERVCDNVFALTPQGGLRHLPGGIEQYLEDEREQPAARAAEPLPALRGVASAGAVLRATRKEVQRLERALERQAERERALHEQIGGLRHRSRAVG